MIWELQAISRLNFFRNRTKTQRNGELYVESPISIVLRSDTSSCGKVDLGLDPMMSFLQ